MGVDNLIQHTDTGGYTDTVIILEKLVIRADVDIDELHKSWAEYCYDVENDIYYRRDEMSPQYRQVAYIDLPADIRTAFDVLSRHTYVCTR